jgi:hypothetical protein
MTATTQPLCPASGLPAYARPGAKTRKCYTCGRPSVRLTRYGDLAQHYPPPGAERQDGPQ